MNVKRCTEKFLAESGLDYTVLQPCGFLQGLIGQYAIPILEKQSIWVMGQATPIAYMDTQDIARFAVKALEVPETVHRTFPLTGTRRLGGLRNHSPVRAQIWARCQGVSHLPRSAAGKFAKWPSSSSGGWNFADRLAFVEVVSGKDPIDAPMDEVYAVFNIDKAEITTLEDYMAEYFSRIMKKLKELDYDREKASKKKLPF